MAIRLQSQDGRVLDLFPVIEGNMRAGYGYILRSGSLESIPQLAFLWPLQFSRYHEHRVEWIPFMGKDQESFFTVKRLAYSLHMSKSIDDLSSLT